ncbi:MAG: LruC domain-containing protein [Mariniphaga sp.]
MKQHFIFTMILVTMSLISCVKKSAVTDPVPIDPASKTMKDLVIPALFNFQTTKDVSLGIVVKNSSSVLSNVPVSVYLDYPGTTESPNVNARLYGTFLSQSDGRIDATIKLPVSQDSLYLTTKYLGLESESGLSISGTTASYKYGEGNTIKSATIPVFSTVSNKAAVGYNYLGTFNTQGVPNYLEPVNDQISQSLLSDVNTTLPESKSLPNTHPQYLVTGNDGDIKISANADVWITFIGEGAGYLNAVGYYTYDINNPPKTRADITKYYIIFPNSSLSGSGGGLVSGNKVKLGSFVAGKAIGWFIVSSGWTNGSTTVNGQTLYFSDPSLNSEVNVAKRQHTVLLKDNVRKLFVLGFEDMNRENGSDDDFNDVLFYVTSNPSTAIDGTVVPVMDTQADDDKDGVINTLDEFPSDATRAFTSYYPGKSQYNTLLVEDLWPSLGDFDFNDMVVDCNYENVTNAQNNVVETYIKLKVRAIGASFKNGFGIQLPVAPSAVSSVTLTNQAGVNTSIGVEAGQDKAVVIAFNDAFALLPSTGGSGVNVIPGNGVSTPKEITLHIVFATPQTVANLGTAPFNPFIYVNGDRTKEIHLPMAKPTAKANVAFFGTSSDTSNPATGRYYKSSNNMIWMMEVPSSFQYTIETNDITKAYLKFGAWAESGGSQNTDWYLDKTGYRNNSLIYK